MPTPDIPKPALTPKAKKFMRANVESAVVFGSAFPSGGGSFTLEDGRNFRLTLTDCRSLPSEPRWIHHKANLFTPIDVPPMF